jgi:hypothetical protein
MAKNPLITDEVRQVIAEIYLKHPDWRAKEIRDGVEARLHKQNPRSKPGWPGLSAVQKELTKQRKTNDARPPESKRLDEPWSLGASVNFGISPEANRDLFDIWRVSLAIDRPISIRQARWIVHLRTLYPSYLYSQKEYFEKVMRNLWLISQSWLYSIREQVSEIVGEEYFDTTDLDAASFMPLWEHATAVATGKVPSVKFPSEQLTKLEEYGTTLEGPPRAGSSVELAVWLAVSGASKGLPIPWKQSEEEDLVSAHWLLYLSKGPNWDSLSRYTRKRIRGQLHEWVGKMMNSNQGGLNLKDTLFLVLLKSVGYPVTEVSIKTLDDTIKDELEKNRKDREDGIFVPDSGISEDD